MPIFRPGKTLGARQDAEAPANPRGGLVRGAIQSSDQQDNTIGPQEGTRQPASEQGEQAASKRQEFLHLQRRKIKAKKRELSLREEMVRIAPDPATERISKRGKKRARRQMFELKKDLRAVKEGAQLEPDAGALPDFLIIGAQKGGTSFLYHLLTQHPLVEPANRKEVHFFDGMYGLGAEWYRWCFPQPKEIDGQKTISGEATPSYLYYPAVPKRVAETVPQAKLIVVLRDPIDRAYSHYQMQVKRGMEVNAFEEAIEHQGSTYLPRGFYVEQLLRWSEFFSREQMLVIKSEHFFEAPIESLNIVLDYLDLPPWGPEASQLRKKHHKGDYEETLDPSTRRRLEKYFAPYNQRLYEFLGVDFGW
jgi:hypothetical protein